MVFHCSLSDSKSPQVSQTFLSILAVLNNAVVWMVSILLIFTPFRVFHTCVSLRFLTGVLVTASLFKSPGLFSVFWPILIILCVVWMVSTCSISKSSSSSSSYYYYYYYYYYFTPFRVFHTSISWWFFTRAWVTASFFKSPGLFSVFWPILTMLLFEWSPLALRFQSLQSLDKTFWVLQIPLIPMVKFKFLSQFLVDPLSHPVLSNFFVLICWIR